MYATVQENQAQLSVISWNINGLKEKLKDERKKEQLLNFFGKYDIVLLQETHLGKKNQNKKKVAKATKLREEKKLLERGLHSENEDEEAMKSEYKDNKMDVENWDKVENKGIIDSEDEDEDKEEMKSEYEENSVDSEKQEEQNKDGIDSEDEDEDEEEMKSEYEENSVDSEKQEEQNKDGIDSENEDEEEMSSEYEENSVDSEKQDEQKKDGIDSEDEDEEEMSSEYEENSVDSEKQDEQKKDGIDSEDEDEDEEEMKSEYEENSVDSEKQEEQNKDGIDSEDEDEEEMKSEYEENSVDSEKQEEQIKDGIDSENEDEDEEEISAEYKNTVDSEMKDEQTDDGIIDSENKDEEKVSIFLKNSGYIVEVLQNQRCIKPRTRAERKIYLTKFCSKSRGVAILVNKQHICLQAFCEGGDYAWVYVEIDNKRYTFVSAYNHPKEKSNLMLRILCSFLKQESKACNWPVIGGDFNTTLNCKLDKGSTKDSTEHKSRRKNILEIMETMELKDVWREKHPNEKVYTFSCRKPMSRLDYVFMLQKHMPCVQNCDIWLDKDMVPKLSDHYPVRLTLTIKN